MRYFSFKRDQFTFTVCVAIKIPLKGFETYLLTVLQTCKLVNKVVILLFTPEQLPPKHQITTVINSKSC